MRVNTEMCLNHQMSGDEKRLQFGTFVDRAFWLLLTSAIFYSSAQLRTLSNNVSELNEKMAIVLTRLGDYDHRLDVLETNVNSLMMKRK